ncbi:MAG: glycosyltransferase [Candidatus Thermoplasmatota archaeon]|nr:glycosyltransferase [Candidatus Thermoplasmatota archaeon]
MKIGLFTTTYYPTPDGVSHYLKDVKLEMERRGHEVHVFSYTGDRKENNVHIPPTLPFPLYTQYSFPINPFPVSMYRLARKIGFDIIHIHDPFMGSIGFRLSKALDIPAVATFHTDFIQMKESVNMPFRNTLFNLTWKYNLYLYRRCDAVLAPSIKTRDYLRSNGVENAEELPLFVDTDRFNALDKLQNGFTVQFLGRITRDKGVFRVLDVAHYLREDSGIKFVISGTGPEEINLRKEIISRGLEKSVSLTGYVDEPMKIDLLSSAKLFIYPSNTDTFGISVLEALASGVPAIVPQDFPLIQYDGIGTSGIVGMDFTDPRNIAEKISGLKNRRNDLLELNDGARNFATANFSKQKHCDRLFGIYEHLIRDRK